MKTYIVVDLQKDFYSPDGRLSVKGADAIPARVAKALQNVDAVIFTLDWHPFAHCSFKPQGGPWPEHCVEYTEGASLPFEVLKAAEGKIVKYYRKGCDPGKEEYGAFENIFEDQMALLKSSDEIVVCGLCGDYCVGATLRNLARLGFGDRLKVDLECTGSIDDGSSLRNTLEELGVDKL